MATLHEKAELKEALKDQLDMSLTAGARQNAHSLVLVIMKTSKAEKQRIEEMFDPALAH